MADRGPTWYRAVIRASDGVDAWFFLGVPAAGAPGQAIFKVGGHEVRSDATFDGKTLHVPLAVHQTAVEGTLGPDGVLHGTFTTSWRAWGASSLPLTATLVAAPAPGALATVASDAAAIDLGQPHSVWRVAMKESGVGKLTIDQTAPGDFAGMLLLDTGNIIYVAGNGRGDTLALCGFDGTSGYRLELAVAADRKHARGKFFGGHRLDWRETLTATRGADFTLAVKAKGARNRVKISLPDQPALAALEPGPLVVELAGSWCSTCRNAAPFLVDLYREYQPRGLHMVTLLYEFSGDHALDAQQAETFKKTYGVTWPVVPIPGGVDEFTEILPKGLDDINPAGFPIALFLAPDRSLVALHAGFPAADAPAEFRRVAAEFRANIEALLASAGTARSR
ncbi:MAG: TlpA family protein disulfide reductase [Deltaproteobacteria bacterium]|nr:MAG: TlpA family protein disulfide reductase [Deltaproteobacteria bacterium]TMQ05297.1 MAG: TlpA family protein disulfide reductase [Deltaproteobacteria bacterium]